MTKSEVQIGTTYNAKISGKLAPVKILAVSQYGGWNGMNTKTGRTVRIYTAAKLRGIYVMQRCGVCDNCKALLAAKADARHAYVAAMALKDGSEAKVNEEWRAKRESMPCKEFF